jgi:preprotein translocase subunit SecA
LLEYDDVMNVQREAIYGKRRNALYGDRLSIDVNNMFIDVADGIVVENQDARDFENFKSSLIRMFGVNLKINESEFLQRKQTMFTENYMMPHMSNYRINNEILAQKVYPIIKDVYENSGRRYDNIAILFLTEKNS